MIYRNFLASTVYAKFHTGIYKTLNCKSGLVESIRTKLQTALETSHLDVINESSTGDSPNGSGIHYRLVVVADKFHGLPMYKRYNLVNDILKEVLQDGNHTFSIVAKTPIQWHRSQAAKELLVSPESGGGVDK